MSRTPAQKRRATFRGDDWARWACRVLAGSGGCTVINTYEEKSGTRDLLKGLYLAMRMGLVANPSGKPSARWFHLTEAGRAFAAAKRAEGGGA